MTDHRKRPLRGLVWRGLALLAVGAALVAGVFTAGCTALGNTPSGERLVRAQASPQWQGGSFRNPEPQWADVAGAWNRLFFGASTPGVEPLEAVPVVRTDAAVLAQPPASGLRATWFGHSSALIELDGARVLIDPLWGERASPVSWAGPKRWFAPTIALDALPPIDAVLISHDHYDHLDQASIVALRKSSRAVFVVPLGLGAHLARWGVPDSRIVELDWWQSTRIGGIEVTATPARHKSSRFFGQQDKTLWAGFAVAGPRHRVWYSGDTGFHGELARIGEQLGPFDLTLIDAGQYDSLWPDTHLGPEAAVRAHQLVRGKTLLPVHWALIKEANHAWTEPAERAVVAARCAGVDLLLPQPGESVEPSLPHPMRHWWPALQWQSAQAAPVLATRRGDPAERFDIAPCANKVAS